MISLVVQFAECSAKARVTMCPSQICKLKHIIYIYIYIYTYIYTHTYILYFPLPYHVWGKKHPCAPAILEYPKFRSIFISHPLSS